MNRLMMCAMVIAVACMSVTALANITAYMPTVCDKGIDSLNRSIQDTMLPVRGTGDGIASYGSTRDSYIMFDLSSIPDKATIISAVFGVCVADINTGNYLCSDPSVGVFYVEDDSWSEDTINWENAPAPSYGGDYQSVVDKQYYEWDILNGIDFQWDWLPDLLDDRISLALLPEFEEINNLAKFFSSEAESNRPYLRIEYAVVPEPTTMVLALIGLGSTAVAIRRKKI